MVIAFANASMKEVLGKGLDIEGKPLLEVLPELKGSHSLHCLMMYIPPGFPIMPMKPLQDCIAMEK